MAVETGIGPGDLLDTDPLVFAEILEILQDRHKQAERANRKAGR